MGDPLRFIDGLFNGIVRFVHSLFTSIAMLLRDPARGAIRLSLKYRRDSAQQVSYLALLFVANCISYVFYDVVSYYPVSSPEEHGGFFVELGRNAIQNVEGTSAIKLLLYATATTAFQNWWIIANIPPAARADVKFNVLKLGYLFCFFYIVCLFSQIVAISLIYIVTLLTKRTIAISVVVAVWIPAALAYIIAGWAMLKKPFPVPHSARKQIAFSLPIILLGTQVGSFILVRLFESVADPPISVLALHCKVSDQSFLEVQTIVFNSTDKPAIIARRDIMILGKPGDDDPAPPKGGPIPNRGGRLFIGLDDSSPRHIVLEPKRTTTLQLNSRKWEGGPGYWGKAQCGVRMEATHSTAADGPGQLPIQRTFSTQRWEVW